eukprot:9235852-Pyramimonas_sp.AAC.1
MGGKALCQRVLYVAVLSESHFDVALCCVEACREELDKFELHRERQTELMQEFGILCVADM